MDIGIGDIKMKETLRYAKVILSQVYKNWQEISENWD